MNEVPLLHEAKSMMGMLREHGFNGDAYTMRAPRSYAAALIDELRSVGVDNLADDERILNIEFATGERLTIEIE